jgi:hypothetical protein
MKAAAVTTAAAALVCGTSLVGSAQAAAPETVRPMSECSGFIFNYPLEEVSAKTQIAIHLRTGPSTSCGDVAGGSVPQGATITAECEYDTLPDSGNYWDFVSYNGVAGWTNDNNISNVSLDYCNDDSA